MGDGGRGLRRPRLVPGWVWVLWVVFVPLRGWAAVPVFPAAEALEGRRIQSIRVRAPSDEDLGEVARLIGFAAGDRLRALDVRSAVERLYQVDRFRTVIVRAQELWPEGVVVHVLLEPRRLLGSIRVLSPRPIGQGWVEEVMRVRRGDVVDERELPDLQDRLRDALERRGWRLPAVGMALAPIEDTARFELIVRIDPGPQTRLARVQLKGRLPLAPWRLDVGVDVGQVLDLNRVEPALEALEARLQKEGYYDAEVAPPYVRSEPSPVESPRAVLVVEVDPGPRVEIRFDGNRRVSRSRLSQDAEALRELGSGEAGLLEARERMLARYERLGYARAQVDVFGRTTPDGQRRQVLFRIREGPGSRVVALRFPGAEFFREGVLRDQVRETVERFLAPALGKPGVDPEVVDRVLSSKRDPRGRTRPSTVQPRVDEVFVPRAYRSAADTIADLYRSVGFQMVEVGAPEVQIDSRELVAVSYPVQEGLRWRIGSIAFTGHQGFSAAELLEVVDMELSREGGEPLVFDEVEEGRRAILDAYRGQGYLFASVQEELREAPRRGQMGGEFFSPRRNLNEVCQAAGSAGKSHCDIEIAYRIEEGPQVRVRDIIIRGLGDTLLSVVEGEIAMRPGDILSDESMVRTRANLTRLGVFERVVVRPVEEERAQAIKDVLVDVRERDNLSLELGVGASTEEGLRAFGAFADRNLFGTALRLQTNLKGNLWAEPLLAIYESGLRAQIREFYRPFGVLGSDPLLLFEYEVAAGLSYPRIFLLPPGFSFGLDVIALRDFDPAFAESNQRVTLIANYEGFKPRLIGRRRPIALQLRTNFERSDLVCNDAVEGREELCSSSIVAANQEGRIEGQNVYFSMEPRLSWDFRDDPLDPRGGAFFELEGEYAVGLDAQSPDYLRTEGRAAFFAPLGPRLTVATSFSGGRIFPLPDDQEIPLNRRFFAGGRSTIRGYPEQTLLPQDVPLGADGNPLSDISTGGLVYLVLQTELRILLVSPVSMAGFIDVGDLWRLGTENGVCPSQGVRLETVCTLPDGTEIRRPLAMGAGFGLRLATPIGPLAVDLGFPVDRRDPAVEDWTLHFSVGTF